MISSFDRNVGRVKSVFVSQLFSKVFVDGAKVNTGNYALSTPNFEIDANGCSVILLVDSSLQNEWSIMIFQIGFANL